jgi:hypothetical protein
MKEGFSSHLPHFRFRVTFTNGDVEEYVEPQEDYDLHDGVLSLTLFARDGSLRRRKIEYSPSAWHSVETIYPEISPDEASTHSTRRTQSH